MEKFYIAALCSANLIGRDRVKKLLKVFGSAESVWNSDSDELQTCGLKSNDLESLLSFRRQNPNAPNKIMDFCEKNNIGLCSIFDNDYPLILSFSLTPPPVLYYYGKLKHLAERIAMVGSRDCTSYGELIATEIAENLAAAGITIVSGMARGIDTCSHIGAMKNGRTVAVLGVGLAYALENSNRDLIEHIVENGVVLSEYPLEQFPTPNTFRSRNRIIAGLSRGVVVVETAEKSGTMITCNYAKDYNRQLFAVPGNVNSPKSVGCNKLIRDGAVLVRNANDVLDFYKKLGVNFYAETT